MNKKLVFTKAVVACASLIFVACVPGHLRKYDKNASAEAKNPDFFANSGDPALPSGKGNTESSSRKKEAAQPSAPRASIYAVDQKTFRFALKENDIWDAALNVLLKNYNVTIVDRQNGIITTEWDSYYLNNGVFRNRVSMRIGKSQWSNVDVTFHNNVEKLKDASQAAATVGAVWLPAEDPANEIGRIVQNMALVLNQPPPVLPPSGAFARGQEKGDKSTF